LNARTGEGRFHHGPECAQVIPRSDFRDNSTGGGVERDLGSDLRGEQLFAAQHCAGGLIAGGFQGDDEGRLVDGGWRGHESPQQSS
jgi:hypothetical protein